VDSRPAGPLVFNSETASEQAIYVLYYYHDSRDLRC
jgi:hypothetical protein